MTRELIEITFGNAMMQARQLENCADDMERLAVGKISEASSDISAAWTGNEAQEYLLKLGQTGDSILKTAGKLREIAETLRSIARTFYRQEVKALEIAQKRTY